MRPRAYRKLSKLCEQVDTTSARASPSTESDKASPSTSAFACFSTASTSSRAKTMPQRPQTACVAGLQSWTSRSRRSVSFSICESRVIKAGLTGDPEPSMAGVAGVLGTDEPAPRCVLGVACHEDDMMETTLLFLAKLLVGLIIPDELEVDVRIEDPFELFCERPGRGRPANDFSRAATCAAPVDGVTGALDPSAVIGPLISDPTAGAWSGSTGGGSDISVGGSNDAICALALDTLPPIRISRPCSTYARSHLRR